MEANAASGPEIPILLAIAAIAALWMFIWKTRTERRATRLIDWVWKNHREDWAALPWVYRNIFRERGLMELARRNVISDPDFVQACGELEPFPRHIVIAAGIGATAIALIVIGIRIFGWNF